MKSFLAISLASFLGLTNLRAQHPDPEPTTDPVLDAIRQFNEKTAGKPNEVSVVLPPPSETPADKPNEKTTSEGAPPIVEVLVTGNPPKNSEVIAGAVEKPIIGEETTLPTPAVAQPRESLSVRVEKLKTGSGQIDISKVKLSAPFPAKPLAPTPVGWHIESSDQVPPFTREVELSPGRKITLSIRPHLLVPDADGSTVFHVAEPGFEPSLGYQQASTVGAILSTSVRQLEEDSKQMGVAIDKLQQLLGSLPKPDPEPEPAAALPNPIAPVKPSTTRRK